MNFMVQARQLRKWHEDAHYCAALFRYLKGFSIKFRSYCQLIFMDDKHRCKVGEPGVPVAAVDREKKVVVSTSGKQFAVADHDFTKFGIVPSVTMLCDIPQSLDESFYRGQVFVGLKDAVLEPSSPLRHCTELAKILSQESISSPILLLYTDGGPDHNLTFLSVQLAIISLYISFDLDMIQAVRTAPYHLWKNPCERVNCILNLGLQAVGLMRVNMDEKFEKVISSCNSMEDIRKAVGKSPPLEEAVKDSIEPVKALLSSQFMRLSLKEKAFRCFISASDHEIDGLFDYLHDIEPTLTRNDRRKECLSKFPNLKQFMDHHCHIRKYVFSVKKCGKTDCSICSVPRLPSEIFKQLSFLPDPVADGEHYKSFEEVYGTCLKQTHRDVKAYAGHRSLVASSIRNIALIFLQSGRLVKKEFHGPSFQHQILNSGDLFQWLRVFDSYLYSCGSSLTGLEEEIRGSDHHSVKDLFSRVYARENLTCEAPVEIPYYSSEMFLSVCTHCGCAWTGTEEGKYPLCDYCKQQGHTPLLKRKRKQSEIKNILVHTCGFLHILVVFNQLNYWGRGLH